MSSQPTVLVTGAAGWTAHAIVQALVGEGYQVVGLDLRAPQAGGGAAAVRWIQGDVANPTAVARASRSASAVVHLAVAVGAGDYRRPQRPFTTNVLGTYNVFDAARRSGMARVVQVSSAAVHLPPGHGPLGASEWRSSPGEDHLYDCRPSSRTGRGWQPPELGAGMKQPRAVDAGQRGLGQPARHNASAATVQPEAAGGRLATDSDRRQSGGPGVPVGGQGWQAYSYARCSGSVSWPPGRW